MERNKLSSNLSNKFFNDVNKYYRFDSSLNYYVNNKDYSLPYNDGNAYEEYVYNFVKNVKDRSEFSKELRGAIKDWPSFYYLSPIRNNIFRPIKKYLKGVGLEAGAGMGALTRELAKEASLLFALEGSKQRARVIGKRCEDLDNVKVLVDDIMKFPIKGLDFITLIGVLEYASCFSNDENSHLNMLKKINDSLNDDGFLIVAIENKLGLKYISGAKEDHVGVSYVGIHDSYKQGTAQTFTRQKLISLFHEAGFNGLKFYYPFPDYKQPKVIITENALGRNDFNLASFMSLCVQEGYPQSASFSKTFSDEALWRVICENKNLQDFSNSFLVIATKNPRTFQKYIDSDIAYAYSSGRDKEFATEVKISSFKGKLVVNRENLYKFDEEDKNHNLCIKQNLKCEDYIEGISYFEKILPMINTPNFLLKDIASLLTPWISYLLQFAVKDNDSGKILIPEKYLDCTPTNLIIGKNNYLYPFDFEWKYKKEYIPILWVIHRGIQGVLTSVEAIADSKDIENKSIIQVIWEIILHLGFNVTNDDVEEVYELENELQSDVTGFKQDIREYLGNPLKVRRSISWYEDKMSEFIKIIYAYENKLNKSQEINI